MITHGRMCGIMRQWHSRKIIADAKTLQQAADRNNVKPIWNYISKAKTRLKRQGSKQSIRTQDNKLTQDERKP